MLLAGVGFLALQIVVPPTLTYVFALPNTCLLVYNVLSILRAACASIVGGIAWWQSDCSQGGASSSSSLLLMDSVASLLVFWDIPTRMLNHKLRGVWPLFNQLLLLGCILYSMNTGTYDCFFSFFIGVVDFPSIFCCMAHLTAPRLVDDDEEEEEEETPKPSCLHMFLRVSFLLSSLALRGVYFPIVSLYQLPNYASSVACTLSQTAPHLLFVPFLLSCYFTVVQWVGCLLVILSFKTVFSSASTPPPSAPSQLI